MRMLTTALSIVEARVAAEKSLFPFTTLIYVWQDKMNGNTKLHEIKSWAKRLFSSYKIVGMFATGHKPIFGEDYVILQVTMTRKQFMYYMEMVLSKDCEDTSDEQLVDDYQNNADFGELFLKRLIKGGSVAPSGKKHVFMKINKDELSRSQL